MKIFSPNDRDDIRLKWYNYLLLLLIVLVPRAVINIVKYHHRSDLDFLIFDTATPLLCFLTAWIMLKRRNISLNIITFVIVPFISFLALFYISIDLLSRLAGDKTHLQLFAIRQDAFIAILLTALLVIIINRKKIRLCSIKQFILATLLIFIFTNFREVHYWYTLNKQMPEPFQFISAYLKDPLTLFYGIYILNFKKL